MMTQKERLVDLYVNYYLQDEHKQFWSEDNRVDEYLKPMADKFSDFLLQNGVIVDVQPTVQNWNTIHKRPMDEEERKYYSERYGYDIEYEEAMIYSNIPVDGQEVLVLGKNGKMWVDEFADDPDIGCWFEQWGEVDGIVAWMELPEPPKERET